MKAINIIKLIQKARCVFYRLLSTNKNVNIINSTISQPVQFVGNGNIVLNNVQIGYFPSPDYLDSYCYIEARNKTAKVTIHDNTFINNGAKIIADKCNIVIGENCLIGFNFLAMDSDFHGLAVKNRMNGIYECADIIVGNNVFIGSNVTLLKGVVIEDGSVIANGAIVTKNVPKNKIVAGVPAKIIGDVPNE